VSYLFSTTASLGLNVVLILVGVGVSVGLLALLHRLPPGPKRRLIVGVTFLAGLFYSVEFFWPGDNFLTDWIAPVGDATRVISAFTFGLGMINLSLVHGKAIRRRREGWVNSVAFFVAMGAMVLVGLWKEYAPTWFSGMVEAPPEGAEVMTAAQASYHVLFYGFLSSLDATMFSLLAFFIVSAGYRAFRVRSAEATLMMAAAFVIMLGQVPIGMAITSWLPTEGVAAHFRVEELANWLMTWVNAAAHRGILFGAAIGGLAMSLRIWLSLEKGAYFEKG